MRKIEYFKKGSCLFAAVLMLGACGQADKVETTTVLISQEEAAETTPAKAEDKTEESSEETSQQEETDSEKEETKETQKTEETEETENTENTEASESEDAALETEVEEEAANKAEEEAASKAEEKAASKAEEEAASKAEEEAASKAEEESTAVEEAASKAPEEQEVETAAAQQRNGKNVNEIYSEITQKVALNTPMVVPNDFITNYYGIDLGVLDEYVFSMSESATSAETVVILKAKDAGSTSSLSAALQTVVDQKRAEMENYLPDQFQIVDKSSVQVNGNYVYLVISEQADAISQIIQAGIQ